MHRATERKKTGAERGRCRVEWDEYQTNDYGLARKKPIVEERQERRKRYGSHQRQHVGALLGGFTWPRQGNGDDRRSSHPCDPLDETTGYPGRYQFADANLSSEPPSTGKNNNHEEDERGNRNRYQGRIGGDQSPSSDWRSQECRNADRQDNGSLGSTDCLWQQLEYSRQSHHIVDGDACVWAEYEAEHRH